ncbi:MAG: hypothetical protein CMP14_08450 [Rickettsiales bacterium]|nr:hypothetical protein [Rickettsiales bacterium]|tara:strand:+ start:661 stop:969 length:309 start_codon:yes stop_codon:yes gene_type:complete
MFKALVLGAVLLGGFFMSKAQTKELMCWNKNPTEALKQNFGEEPYAYMITSGGMLQIIFLNIKKGNWSIVIQPPDRTDLYCYGGSGVEWSHFTTESKRKIKS